MNHDGPEMHLKAAMGKLSADIQERLAKADKEWDIFVPCWIECEKDGNNIMALGSAAFFLNRWYNGIEDICAHVIKGLDKEVEEKPEDKKRWHKALLEKMSSATDTREAILSPEDKGLLDTVLGFRHIGRGLYGGELRSDRMKPAVEAAFKVKPRLELVFSQLCEDLES